ncbi:hypothetical protein DPMN_169580 [Dreissena polymorpha]|uniref:Uncharacterized protein n=1 Tax=Dreissena polymorpha TaxID=45954 RepID=A0A9D4DVT0_DREPO|nr:hypothetical protein DPMN_169580 [Dreissena polymorpha]
MVYEESMVIRERSQQASASIGLVASPHPRQYDPAECACHKPGANAAWGVSPDGHRRYIYFSNRIYNNYFVNF